MRRGNWLGAGVLLAACAVGCSGGPRGSGSGASPEAKAADEAAVRARFAELQAGAKDDEKVWALMDEMSKAAAEKKAQQVREEVAKLDAGGKALAEKDYGLSAAELAKVTGKGLLKTKKMRHELEEMAESRLDKVVIGADDATVHFVEPNGKEERLRFVRRGGQWQAWMTIPQLRKGP
jgi:hypothetical protein